MDNPLKDPLAEWFQAAAWLVRHMPRSWCRCGERVRPGGATCGDSRCQEADYHANKERNRGRRGRK